MQWMLPSTRSHLGLSFVSWVHMVHHACKRQRTTNWPLMDHNLLLKLFTLPMLHSHHSSCFFTSGHHCFHHFSTCSFLNTSLGILSNAFSTNFNHKVFLHPPNQKYHTCCSLPGHKTKMHAIYIHFISQLSLRTLSSTFITYCHVGWSLETKAKGFPLAKNVGIRKGIQSQKPCHIKYSKWQYIIWQLYIFLTTMFLIYLASSMVFFLLSQYDLIKSHQGVGNCFH